MIIGFDSLCSDKWQLFGFSCCLSCFPLSLRFHTENESKVSKEQVLSLDITKKITRGCLSDNKEDKTKTSDSEDIIRIKSREEDRTYQAKGSW